MNDTTPISTLNTSPVCMGGVGGSGTRVGAEIMLALGIYIGPVLNRANDNFSFPPLKKKLLGIDDEAQKLDVIMQGLQGFEQTMHAAFLEQTPGVYNNWGWKIPGSYYWLPYTSRYFPNIKYIHFIRSGLDMAFSRNRQQAKNWGWMFDLKIDDKPTPEQLLHYWIAANKHAITTGQELLGDRFLIVNFDALCQNPAPHIQAICDFLGYPLDSSSQQQLCQLVRPPSSINRYKNHNIKQLFTPQAIQSVNDLGFHTDY